LYGLRANTPVRLRASKAGYLSREITISTTASMVQLDIELTRQ